MACAAMIQFTCLLKSTTCSAITFSLNCLNIAAKMVTKCVNVPSSIGDVNELAVFVKKEVPTRTFFAKGSKYVWVFDLSCLRWLSLVKINNVLLTFKGKGWIRFAFSVDQLALFFQTTKNISVQTIVEEDSESQDSAVAKKSSGKDNKTDGTKENSPKVGGLSLDENKIEPVEAADLSADSDSSASVVDDFLADEFVETQPPLVFDINDNSSHEEANNISSYGNDNEETDSNGSIVDECLQEEFVETQPFIID